MISARLHSLSMRRHVYDICDDRRLAKVHKTTRGFGDHLQYSIFECQFNAADLAREWWWETSNH